MVIKNKTLKIFYIVSTVFGVAALVLFFAIGVFDGLTSSSEKGIYIVAAPIILFIFITQFCGILLNWRDFLRGMFTFRPIPIIAAFPPYFKGWFYALKGLIAMFKGKDLTIGKPEESEE